MNLDRLLVKAKRVDNGEWVVGHVHHNENATKAHIHKVCERVTSYDVDPETICQCSGLKDKDGALVFDGDRVKVIGEWCEEDKWYHFNGLAVVMYSLGAYTIQGQGIGTYIEFLDIGTIEVTGNIHDSKGE